MVDKQTDQCRNRWIRACNQRSSAGRRQMHTGILKDIVQTDTEQGGQHELAEILLCRTRAVSAGNPHDAQQDTCNGEAGKTQGHRGEGFICDFGGNEG